MKENEIYKFFADYIYKHSGIFYQENDFYRLESRLKTIAKTHGTESIEKVYEMYQMNITNEMHTTLINIATNNETYFLRDGRPFKSLTKSVIPELLVKGPRPISIWSSGCSSGQEPYSILMSIQNKNGMDIFNNINITATDLSTEALKKGKKGNYDGLEIQRGLPAPMLIKYFSQEEDETWTVNEELKSKVNFKEFNLLTDTYSKEIYEIIFCRNVLIYQDRENKKNILNNIYLSLKPGGFLFMGSGENMINMGLPFKQKKVEESMLYFKEAI